MKLILCLLMLCVFFAGCSSRPNTSGTRASASPVEVKKITSTGVVHATAKPVVDISPGGSGELIVALKIDNGYHVNANPPTFPYLKATELLITPSEGFSATPISYPPATTKKFPFADKPLAVYEGDLALKSTIKANTSAPRGEHSMAAVLRVQACDEQVCYPPGQIDLRIPILMK
jgi:ABC-type Fe3+-hydroxamate transport system substrate-binding protein